MWSTLGKCQKFLSLFHLGCFTRKRSLVRILHVSHH